MMVTDAIIPKGWKGSKSHWNEDNWQGNEMFQRHHHSSVELNNMKDDCMWSTCFLTAGYQNPCSPVVTKDEQMVKLRTRRKLLNKRQKAKNGNQNQFKISHWNAGSKHWENKLPELELLSHSKQDLCFISESNLWAGLQPHETELEGHRLIYP